MSYSGGFNNVWLSGARAADQTLKLLIVDAAIFPHPRCEGTFEEINLQLDVCASRFKKVRVL